MKRFIVILLLVIVLGSCATMTTYNDLELSEKVDVVFDAPDAKASVVSFLVVEILLGFLGFKYAWDTAISY